MGDQHVLKHREKLFLWAFIALLALLFISAISAILLPFVASLILAYFLDPAADKLESYKVPRGIAALLITITAFCVIITASMLLVPVFYQQFLALAHNIPDYASYIQTYWLPKLNHSLEDVDPHVLQKSKDLISNASTAIFQYAGDLLARFWDSGLAVINLLSLVFITPIVTFYLLRDWDTLQRSVNRLLPLEYADVIREQAKEIDRTLAGYIRGQTNVCLFLGLFYGIGLTLVGLNFGMFIGLATGILSFIPYVGLLFGFIVGLVVGLFQFWGNWVPLGYVIAVYAIGQLLESNFVTPKLVGDKVGLHPVWIIFGLLAGGAMFGFVGMLVAVPVTACIGVLVRFGITRYRTSLLYLGQRPNITEEAIDPSLEV